MQDTGTKLNLGTRIFFSLFFLAVASSIATTYYNMVILRNYHSFSEEEEIPDPTEIYARAAEAVIGLFK